MGEAPASPNTAKVVASWMGPVRRGLGVSFHIVGIGLGGDVCTYVCDLAGTTKRLANVLLLIELARGSRRSSMVVLHERLP